MQTGGEGVGGSETRHVAHQTQVAVHDTEAEMHMLIVTQNANTAETEWRNKTLGDNSSGGLDKVLFVVFPWQQFILSK